MRTPDHRARIAVLKGFSSPAVGIPHTVYQIRDDIDLGNEIARFWPTKKSLPAEASMRDTVGDFRKACRFAFESARTSSLLTFKHE